MGARWCPGILGPPAKSTPLRPGPNLFTAPSHHSQALSPHPRHQAWRRRASPAGVPHLPITSVGRRGSSKGWGAADDMYGRPWLNSLPGHSRGTWQLRGMKMAWTALGVEGNAAKH